MSARHPRRRDLLRGLGGALLVSTPAVAHANDSGSAFFEISGSHSPNVVEEGGAGTVSGTIRNTGDAPGTQIVRLEITRDGSTVETRETTFTLDPGESTTHSQTMTYESYPGPGSYRGRVCTNDDCASDTWTVAEPDDDDDDDDDDDEQEPAIFEVELGDVTQPTAGNPIEATVGVENTGGEAGEQSVVFTVGELGADATTVALNSGESTDITLSVATEPGDAGSYTATVESENDADSRTVTVESRPARFEVEFVEVIEPTAGTPIETTVHVTNTGGSAAEQDIELSIDGLGTDSQSVDLSSGESAELTLSVATEPGDAGSYTATVESQDDDTSRSVTVEPTPATFQVELDSVTEPAEGDPVEAAVSLENTGGEAGEQSVVFTVEGLGSVAETVALDGGASTDLALSVETEPGDAGSYTATVESEDDVDSRELTVTGAETPEPTPTPDDSGDDGASDSTGNGGETDDGQSDDTDEPPDDTADDDGPGFGVGGALASLGGVAYVLSRRLGRSDERQQS